jgi:hypothetical protein
LEALEERSIIRLHEGVEMLAAKAEAVVYPLGLAPRDFKPLLREGSAE